MRKFVGFRSAREIVAQSFAAEMSAKKESIVSFADYLPRVSVRVAIPALEMRRNAALAREMVQGACIDATQKVQEVVVATAKRTPQMTKRAARLAWKALSWTARCYTACFFAVIEAQAAQKSFHHIVGHGNLRDAAGRGIYKSRFDSCYKSNAALLGI